MEFEAGENLGAGGVNEPDGGPIVPIEAHPGEKDAKGEQAKGEQGERGAAGGEEEGLEAGEVEHRRGGVICGE